MHFKYTISKASESFHKPLYSYFPISVKKNAQIAKKHCEEFHD